MDSCLEIRHASTKLRYPASAEATERPTQPNHEHGPNTELKLKSYRAFGNRSFRLQSCWEQMAKGRKPLPNPPKSEMRASERTIISTPRELSEAKELLKEETIQVKLDCDSPKSGDGPIYRPSKENEAPATNAEFIRPHSMRCLNAQATLRSSRRGHECALRRFANQL